MNIKYLKYAVEIAKSGSINKAAEQLYIAQPNLTRAIKELEKELSITIFDRNAKGMTLTPDGEKLIQYGKRILKEIDDVEELANFYHDTVFVAMGELRASADEIETLVGEKYWPYPTYGELLFYVK